jgi:hypothetical protein
MRQHCGHWWCWCRCRCRCRAAVLAGGGGGGIRRLCHCAGHSKSIGPSVSPGAHARPGHTATFGQRWHAASGSHYIDHRSWSGACPAVCLAHIWPLPGARGSQSPPGTAPPRCGDPAGVSSGLAQMSTSGPTPPRTLMSYGRCFTPACLAAGWWAPAVAAAAHLLSGTGVRGPALARCGLWAALLAAGLLLKSSGSATLRSRGSRRSLWRRIAALPTNDAWPGRAANCSCGHGCGGHGRCALIPTLVGGALYGDVRRAQCACDRKSPPAPCTWPCAARVRCPPCASCCNTGMY